MLNLLNWLVTFVKEKPRTIAAAVLIAFFYFITPKFVVWVGKVYDNSQSAMLAQLELLKNEIKDCRAWGAAEARKNDSLQAVIHKKDEDNNKALEKRNEALSKLADKYQEQNMKLQQYSKTIDNIQKKVSNEISN